MKIFKISFINHIVNSNNDILQKTKCFKNYATICIDNFCNKLLVFPNVRCARNREHTF